MITKQTSEHHTVLLMPARSTSDSADQNSADQFPKCPSRVDGYVCICLSLCQVYTNTRASVNASATLPAPSSSSSSSSLIHSLSTLEPRLTKPRFRIALTSTDSKTKENFHTNLQQ